MIKNRKILAALILAMAVPFTMTASAQQPKQIKVGTFKLIHMMAPVWWERFLPKDVKVEIVYFASSLDIEKAVVNGNVDFGDCDTITHSA